MTSPSEKAYPFKQARHFRPGRAAKIRYAVVHCTASPENTKGTGAEATQSYFTTAERVGSTHLIADQNSVVRSVHDWDTAFGAKGFNAPAVHLELVGMPGQSRAQWLDGISRDTIRQGAGALAEWCLRYNLLQSYVSLADLKAQRGSGLTFHVDCEKAAPSSGHWDPGPNFPRDVLLADVREIARSMGKPAVRLNPYLHYLEAVDLVYRGSTGGPVRGVEWALGLPIDGVWESTVEGTIRRLQRRHGRAETGRVEGWTLEYLKTVTR